MERLRKEILITFLGRTTFCKEKICNGNYMKKQSVFIITLFALGLYVVPATFAGESFSASKDKESGQSVYQKDQKRPAQTHQGQQLQQQLQNQQKYRYSE
jgi:hypothetical protein